MPPKFISILEDNAPRAAAMRQALARAFPSLNVVICDAAPDMIAWLAKSLADTALISLDHDLVGRDAGTGRAVAEWLAQFPCCCPVIVHTSNAQAAPGMLRVLREAGWVCSAVVPCDDLTWIDADWREEVEQYHRRGLMFW